LDSNNLITKIYNEWRNDSIAVKKIDEQQQVVEYWYQYNYYFGDPLPDRKFYKQGERDNIDYYLGGKRFYENDVLVKEQSYYMVGGERDSVSHPRLWKTTHFYYDKDGFLMREDGGYEKTLYTYKFRYNPLPGRIIRLENDSITHTSKFEY